MRLQWWRASVRILCWAIFPVALTAHPDTRSSYVLYISAYRYPTTVESCIERIVESLGPRVVDGQGPAPAFEAGGPLCFAFCFTNTMYTPHTPMTDLA